MKMLAGQALIYERADGVVYARYRDPPHNNIPRWIVGGSPEGVSRAQGDLFTHAEWQHMVVIAKNNNAFKKQLDRLILMYYTIKDAEELKE
tara:strand:- start:560 stop:832 length:273 start_codon:yes stop_codon:yes gene_type:complete